jgi:adenosylcobinamide-GDP ribazoletransferase
VAVKGLLSALGFLTRLPVPRAKLSMDDFVRAVPFYPAAGFAVGVVVASAGWSLGHVDPWLGAMAAVAAWAAVTGALHLDGLGDLADGLGAAHGDRTRFLAVMADPHIGSFGVIALVLQLAAKLVLLHLLVPGDWLAVLAIPAAARLGPLLWARMLTPLRPEGLGAAIATAVRMRDLIGWGAILVGAIVLLPALAATPVVLVLLAWWFRLRVGGVTGDVHGAGVELTETALLLAFVLQRAV